MTSERGQKDKHASRPSEASSVRTMTPRKASRELTAKRDSGRRRSASPKLKQSKENENRKQKSSAAVQSSRRDVSNQSAENKADNGSKGKNSAALKSSSSSSLKEGHHPVREDAVRVSQPKLLASSDSKAGPRSPEGEKVDSPTKETDKVTSPPAELAEDNVSQNRTRQGLKSKSEKELDGQEAVVTLLRRPTETLAGNANQPCPATTPVTGRSSPKAKTMSSAKSASSSSGKTSSTRSTSPASKHSTKKTSSAGSNVSMTSSWRSLMSSTSSSRQKAKQPDMPRSQSKSKELEGSSRGRTSTKETQSKSVKSSGKFLSATRELSSLTLRKTPSPSSLSERSVTTRDSSTHSCDADDSSKSGVSSTSETSSRSTVASISCPRFDEKTRHKTDPETPKKTTNKAETRTTQTKVSVKTTSDAIKPKLSKTPKDDHKGSPYSSPLKTPVPENTTEKTSAVESRSTQAAIGNSKEGRKLPTANTAKQTARLSTGALNWRKLRTAVKTTDTKDVSFRGSCLGSAVADKRSTASPFKSKTGTGKECQAEQSPAQLGRESEDSRSGRSRARVAPRDTVGSQIVAGLQKTKATVVKTYRTESAGKTRHFEKPSTVRDKARKPGLPPSLDLTGVKPAEERKSKRLVASSSKLDSQSTDMDQKDKFPASLEEHTPTLPTPVKSSSPPLSTPLAEDAEPSDSKKDTDLSTCPPTGTPPLPEGDEVFTNTSHLDCSSQGSWDLIAPSSLPPLGAPLTSAAHEKLEGGDEGEREGGGGAGGGDGAVVARMKGKYEAGGNLPPPQLPALRFLREVATREEAQGGREEEGEGEGEGSSFPQSADTEAVPSQPSQAPVPAPVADRQQHSDMTDTECGGYSVAVLSEQAPVSGYTGVGDSAVLLAVGQDSSSSPPAETRSDLVHKSSSQRHETGEEATRSVDQPPNFECSTIVEATLTAESGVQSACVTAEGSGTDTMVEEKQQAPPHTDSQPRSRETQPRPETEGDQAEAAENKQTAVLPTLFKQPADKTAEQIDARVNEKPENLLPLTHPHPLPVPCPASARQDEEGGGDKRGFNDVAHDKDFSAAGAIVPALRQPALSDSANDWPLKEKQAAVEEDAPLPGPPGVSDWMPPGPRDAPDESSEAPGARAGRSENAMRDAGLTGAPVERGRENCAEVLTNGAEVHEDGAEIQETGAEIRENRVEIHENRAEIHETSAEIRENRVEIHENRAEIQDTSAEIRKHRVEIRENRAEIQDTSAEIRENRVEVHENRAEIQEISAEIRESRVEIHETSAEILANGAEVHENETEIQETSAEIHGDSAEIQGNSAEVQGQNLRVGEASEEDKGEVSQGAVAPSQPGSSRGHSDGAACDDTDLQSLQVERERADQVEETPVVSESCHPSLSSDAPADESRLTALPQGVPRQQVNGSEGSPMAQLSTSFIPRPTLQAPPQSQRPVGSAPSSRPVVVSVGTFKDSVNANVPRRPLSFRAAAARHRMTSSHPPLGCRPRPFTPYRQRPKSTPCLASYAAPIPTPGPRGTALPRSTTLLPVAESRRPARSLVALLAARPGGVRGETGSEREGLASVLPADTVLPSEEAWTLFPAGNAAARGRGEQQDAGEESAAAMADSDDDDDGGGSLTDLADLSARHLPTATATTSGRRLSADVVRDRRRHSGSVPRTVSVTPEVFATPEGTLSPEIFSTPLGSQPELYVFSEGETCGQSPVSFHHHDDHVVGEMSPDGEVLPEERSDTSGSFSPVQAASPQPPSSDEEDDLPPYSAFLAVISDIPVSSAEVEDVSPRQTQSFSDAENADHHGQSLLCERGAESASPRRTESAATISGAAPLHLSAVISTCAPSPPSPSLTCSVAPCAELGEDQGGGAPQIHDAEAAIDPGVVVVTAAGAGFGAVDSVVSSRLRPSPERSLQDDGQGLTTSDAADELQQHQQQQQRSPSPPLQARDSSLDTAVTHLAVDDSQATTPHLHPPRSSSDSSDDSDVGVLSARLLMESCANTQADTVPRRYHGMDSMSTSSSSADLVFSSSSSSMEFRDLPHSPLPECLRQQARSLSVSPEMLFLGGGSPVLGQAAVLPSVCDVTVADSFRTDHLRDIVPSPSASKEVLEGDGSSESYPDVTAQPCPDSSMSRCDPPAVTDSPDHPDIRDVTDVSVAAQKDQGPSLDPGLSEHDNGDEAPRQFSQTDQRPWTSPSLPELPETFMDDVQLQEEPAGDLVEESGRTESAGAVCASSVSLQQEAPCPVVSETSSHAIPTCDVIYSGDSMNSGDTRVLDSELAESVETSQHSEHVGYGLHSHGSSLDDYVVHDTLDREDTDSLNSAEPLVTAVADKRTHRSASDQSSALQLDISNDVMLTTPDVTATSSTPPVITEPHVDDSYDYTSPVQVGWVLHVCLVTTVYCFTSWHVSF